MPPKSSSGGFTYGNYVKNNYKKGITRHMKRKHDSMSAHRMGKRFNNGTLQSTVYKSKATRVREQLDAELHKQDEEQVYEPSLDGVQERDFLSLLGDSLTVFSKGYLMMSGYYDASVSKTIVESTSIVRSAAEPVIYLSEEEDDAVDIANSDDDDYIASNSAGNVDTELKVDEDDSDIEDVLEFYSDENDDNLGVSVHIETNARFQADQNTSHQVDVKAGGVSKSDILLLHQDPILLLPPQKHTEDTLLHIIRHHFGLRDFRPGQVEAVLSLLRQESTLLVLPTSGGKSLCYILAAYILKHCARASVCIVVSPLISLMSNQLQSLPQPVTAAAWTGNTTNAQTELLLRSQTRGEQDILYVAPERQGNRVSRRILLQALQVYTNTVSASPSTSLSSPYLIPFCTVDEAHCVSEWSHAFRPDYLYLSVILRDELQCPVLALTATASRNTIHDVSHTLHITNIRHVNILRRNQFYSVVYSRNQMNDLQSALRSPLYRQEVLKKGRSCIVYTTTHQQCESVCIDLQSEGHSAGMYHGGLSLAHRQSIQTKFEQGHLNIIVATVAFGMGIDQQRVGLVVHFTCPAGIEQQQQETGRAGRDGLPSYCLVFVSDRDLNVHASHAHSEGTDMTAVCKISEYIYSKVQEYKFIESIQHNRNDTSDTYDMEQEEVSLLPWTDRKARTAPAQPQDTTLVIEEHTYMPVLHACAYISLDLEALASHSGVSASLASTILTHLSLHPSKLVTIEGKFHCAAKIGFLTAGDLLDLAKNHMSVLAVLEQHGYLEHVTIDEYEQFKKSDATVLTQEDSFAYTNKLNNKAHTEKHTSLRVVRLDIPGGGEKRYAPFIESTHYIRLRPKNLRSLELDVCAAATMFGVPVSAVMKDLAVLRQEKKVTATYVKKRTIVGITRVPESLDAIIKDVTIKQQTHEIYECLKVRALQRVLALSGRFALFSSNNVTMTANTTESLQVVANGVLSTHNMTDQLKQAITTDPTQFVMKLYQGMFDVQGGLALLALQRVLFESTEKDNSIEWIQNTIPTLQYLCQEYLDSSDMLELCSSWQRRLDGIYVTKILPNMHYGRVIERRFLFSINNNNKEYSTTFHNTQKHVYSIDSHLTQQFIPVAKSEYSFLRNLFQSIVRDNVANWGEVVVKAVHMDLYDTITSYDADTAGSSYPTSHLAEQLVPHCEVQVGVYYPRALARLSHGIPSPQFPHAVWGSHEVFCRYRHMDFFTCLLAATHACVVVLVEETRRHYTGEGVHKLGGTGQGVWSGDTIQKIFTQLRAAQEKEDIKQARVQARAVIEQCGSAETTPVDPSYVSDDDVCPELLAKIERMNKK